MKHVKTTAHTTAHGKVHVYLFDELDSLSAGFAAENIQRFPTFRREQCSKYRQVADKNTCIIAYLLLEKGLREQYGVTEPPAFTYNEYGKPYLTDTPHIFFNFSHCRRGVVCALADFEVGIDMQDIRPYDEVVARRVCNGDELRQLAQCDDPARLFCSFWVKKESYAKANGLGIAAVLKHELPDSGFVTRAGEYYLISLFHNTRLANAEVNIITCQLPIK